MKASTVQYIDCAIRRDECRDQNYNTDSPDIPGFCAVGRIIAIAPNISDGMFRVGDRVGTIVHTGGNARFCVQSASKLVKISEEENAHDACGLLSTYMAAFACLRHTTPKSDRYEMDCLDGQTVFVNGGMSAVGQAIINLSQHLGAIKVYATGKEKDFHHLEGLGADPILLGKQIIDHKLKVDVIIDCTSFDILDYLLSLKKESGRLVYYRHGDISMDGHHGWRTYLPTLLLKFRLMISSQNDSFCDPVQDIFLDRFDVFKVSLYSLLSTLCKLEMDKFFDVDIF